MRSYLDLKKSDVSKILTQGSFNSLRLESWSKRLISLQFCDFYDGICMYVNFPPRNLIWFVDSRYACKICSRRFFCIPARLKFGVNFCQKKGHPSWKIWRSGDFERRGKSSRVKRDGFGINLFFWSYWSFVFRFENANPITPRVHVMSRGSKQYPVWRTDATVRRKRIAHKEHVLEPNGTKQKVQRVPFASRKTAIQRVVSESIYCET